MSEMTEQERGAAVIARSPQRYADLRAITELRSFSPEETALLVRVANAGADLIQAQHRELDRLTAERDAARADADKLFALLNTLESAMDLAHFELTNDFRIERLPVAVVFLRKGLEFARAALGIESEASE